MARSREYDDDEPEDDFEDDRPRRRRGGGGGGTPPPNYLVPAIIVTLCCCLIGGIVAIINATQVNTKWAAGDYEGAQKASDNAKLWVMLSAGIGLAVNVILIIVNVAMQGQAAR